MTDSDPDLSRVDPEGDVQMTIWEHLGELRRRVFRAALALLGGAAVSWTFREKLLAWIAEPYKKQWEVHFPQVPLELQTLAPADVFMNYVQLSLMSGVVLSSPVIFYQLWAFISPGLYAREKRYIVPFVFFSTLLFLSGVAFAYYVAFPFTFHYFFSLLGELSPAGAPAGAEGIILSSRPTMEYYVDFTTRTLLAFGFVFELPLFIAFLTIAGIVRPRQLVRFTRYAIIGAFVVGAFVTPGPEISSQIAVSGALIVLYLVSVALSFVVARKRDVDSPPEEAKKSKAVDDE
jgi:sec-independent protein translocase protein TatC